MRRAIVAFACVALLATPPARARAAPPNGMLAAAADDKLVTLNPDGSGLRVLSTPQDPGPITGLAWSPDGNRLAVAQADRIAVLDLLGGGCVVPHGAGVRDLNPAWGPLGARIGFRRITSTGQWAVKALVDCSQPERQMIVGDPTEFAWAPDLGRWALAGPLGLTLPGLDDPLAPKVVGAPSWSPDGTRLAFSDGVSLRTVTTDRLPVTATVVTDGGTAPRWSPDGESLVYAAGTEVRVVAAAGGTRPRSVLPAMGTNVTAVDWQPCRSDTTLCESVAPPRCSATAATVSTQTDQPVDIPPPPCTDPADRRLTLVVVRAPEHGTLSGRRYTPAPGFTGQDLVGYRVSNGALESETVRVTIFVVPPPTAAVRVVRPPVLPVGAPFLSARATPKLDRRRRTAVRLACDQNCAFSVRLLARLRSKRTLRGLLVRHTLVAGRVLTVHLRLPSKPKGTVKTAWITGTVRNGAGDARAVRLPVTLPR